jgi:hypothetical protein
MAAYYTVTHREEPHTITPHPATPDSPLRCQSPQFHVARVAHHLRRTFGTYTLMLLQLRPRCLVLPFNMAEPHCNAQQNSWFPLHIIIMPPFSHQLVHTSETTQVVDWTAVYRTLLSPFQTHWWIRSPTPVVYLVRCLYGRPWLVHSTSRQDG